MKKTKRKVGETKKVKNREVVGLIDSPLVKGLAALIPMILLLVVAGLSLTDIGERRAILRAGLFPSSQLAHFGLAEAAAREGDYALAEEEYFLGLRNGDESPTILGVNSYLEDLIWPERKIRAEIEFLEQMKTAVVSREIHARLAVLYDRLGESEKVRIEVEAAKEIDPNDEQTKRVETLVAE